MVVLAVLTVLVVLESALSSFCLSYKIQHNEATVAVLAAMAVSVMTATPLKLNPPCSVILTDTKASDGENVVREALKDHF